MSFARMAFQYASTACSPTALFIDTMYQEVYKFVSPLTTTTTTAPAGATHDSLARTPSDRSIGRNSHRFTSSTSLSSIELAPIQLKTPTDIPEWGVRSNPIQAISASSTLTRQSSDRSMGALPALTPRYSPATNTALTALYLLTPLFSGLIGSCSDGLGLDALASAGAVITGFFLAITAVLTLSTYEPKIDCINQKGSETKILRDLPFIFLKASIATIPAVTSGKLRGLDATTIAYNTALGISLAIIWQLIQTRNRSRMNSQDKSLTSLSTGLARSSIMLATVLTSFGTFLYLNPVLSLNADPLIPDSMPRVFWGLAYASGFLAFMNLILQKTPHCEPLTSGLTRIIAAFMNARSFQSLLSITPQIAFSFKQPALETRNAVRTSITTTAAAIAVAAGYFKLDSYAITYLTTHRRYEGPSHAITDTPPQPSSLTTPAPQSTCLHIKKYVKKNAPACLQILMYTADVTVACMQFQKLFGIPYSAANNIIATLTLTGVALPLGLWGALSTTLETTPRAGDHAASLTCWQRFLQCGKSLDKPIAITVEAAGVAYAITFVYGIYALYYNKPVNALIADGELPVSNFTTGLIAGTALGTAACIISLRNHLIKNTMAQNTAAPPAASAIALTINPLSGRGQLHTPPEAGAPSPDDPA